MMAEVRSSWVPMLVVGLAQVQLALNIDALAVSIGGMVDSFGVAPTMVGTAIVAYSLMVAGFIMMGAKLAQRLGARRTFRIANLIFLAAVLAMVTAPTMTVVVLAQFAAGAAAALLVPTFVILITASYSGQQQAEALGLLGAVQAAGSAGAFLLAGVAGTLLGWRWAYALIVPLTLLVLLLSARLPAGEKDPAVSIDLLGVVLAATAVILVATGFDRLNAWGTLLASPSAPWSVVGLSPAVVMIVGGVLASQLFLAWSMAQQARGRTPLLPREIISKPEQKAAIFALAAIMILAGAMTFLVPLYLQMVLDRSSLETAISLIPHQAAVALSAVWIVSRFDRWSPRQIDLYGFLAVAIGLIGLALVVRNEWGRPPVILMLTIIGLGQGALVTMLFTVMVASAPKSLAGDVGALRGTVNNLGWGVGTAFAGALAVGLLAASIEQGLAAAPAIPATLAERVNLDEMTFMDNSQLQAVLSRKSISTAQSRAAFEINAEARLNALRLSLLILGGLALLMVIPGRNLPGHTDKQISGFED
jgi:predicted MFS family arabinose efflux permease